MSTSSMMGKNGGSVPQVEQLEGRLVMSAAPTITSVFADNRGEVVLDLSAPLKKSTVDKGSVRVFTAGPDGELGTSDDVRRKKKKITLNLTKRKLTIDANLKADREYRVLLIAKTIRGRDDHAHRLDGEFNGANEASGDGQEGGNFTFRTTVDENEPIARFKTVLGNIDVRLFTDDTPLTVENFLHYANAGDWDGTFFHRALDNFVIQGGGFTIDNDGHVDEIEDIGPVQNEPVLSNIRGTIAMAKIENQPNSATNEWFFNLGDNSANLDNQNSGFTVFGEVADAASLAVMDAIGELNQVNAGDFQSVPVTDDTIGTGLDIDQKTDLAFVRKISIKMNVRKV